MGALHSLLQEPRREEARRSGALGLHGGVTVEPRGDLSRREKWSQGCHLEAAGSKGRRGDR